MNEQYLEGRNAKTGGWGKLACPYSMEIQRRDKFMSSHSQCSEMQKRHWWLAGWHDKDIEIGNSVIREAMP